MNAASLKDVLSDPTLWQRGVRSIANLVDMRRMNALQRTFAVSSVFVHMPHLVQRDDVVPPDIGRVFKFFRGIHAYSLHRLILGDGHEGESMYEYTLRSGQFVSRTGVCPATKSLCDKIESELPQLCLEPSALQGEDQLPRQQTLPAALTLSASFEVFGIVCSLLFLSHRAAKSEPKEAPASYLAAFPLPGLTWLATADLSNLNKPYFRGLQSVLDCLEPLGGVTAEVRILVDKVRMGDDPASAIAEAEHIVVRLSDAAGGVWRTGEECVDQSGSLATLRGILWAKIQAAKVNVNAASCT
jgi:hypothetical protein